MPQDPPTPSSLHSPLSAVDISCTGSDTSYDESLVKAAVVGMLDGQLDQSERPFWVQEITRVLNSNLVLRQRAIDTLYEALYRKIDLEDDPLKWIELAAGEAKPDRMAAVIHRRYAYFLKKKPAMTITAAQTFVLTHLPKMHRENPSGWGKIISDHRETLIELVMLAAIPIENDTFKFVATLCRSQFQDADSHKIREYLRI